MIEIDSSGSAPIGEQLVAQLRFLIASGQYRSGERLPSTRVLGRQLGISFHTVRKAYQALEHEGVLLSKKGSGFTVVGARVPSAADRMERGAAVVQDALHRLIGLGMTEEEVDYVLEEQRQFFETPGAHRRFVFASFQKEIAETCAQQLAENLVQRVDAVLIPDLHRHSDADTVFSPHPALQAAMQAVGGPEHMSVTVSPATEAVERSARLSAREQIAIITRAPETLEPLSEMLRAASGFSGAILAVSMTTDRELVSSYIRRAQLVLYTPAVRRRVKPLLGDRPGAAIGPYISAESMERIRTEVGA